MSREIITIQGFRTVIHFFLFFFLELTNVDTIKHFFKFLTIHFETDFFFLFFPSKHNGSLFIYNRTLMKKSNSYMCNFTSFLAFSVFPVKTQRITFYLSHFNEKYQIHTRAISRVFWQAMNFWNFHFTQLQLDESTAYN